MYESTTIFVALEFNTVDIKRLLQTVYLYSLLKMLSEKHVIHIIYNEPTKHNSFRIPWLTAIWYEILAKVFKTSHMAFLCVVLM